MNPTDVANILSEAGHLQKNENGKNTLTHRIDASPNKVDRFYTIDLEKKSNEKS